ncbi:hypothetical protein [Clostridium butyricum]|uniref:Uncharacterized protein n=2 Tax=Clostridium butyricum TaxID=1492 RepID=A0A2S7FAB0_CLOBU|nr:hypothetical protein [Clostridium butyricum]KHD15795.1 hypothetical protein OA81_08135 [Clostridium butyricum]PPV14664.1 hypothetical protein AWN73_02840 [Clostridium butyricum]
MIEIVCIIIGILILLLMYNIKKDIIEQKRKKSMYYEYYNNLNVWIKIKNSYFQIEDYIKENNINSIAIYGVGDLGTRLYEELKESSVEIKYFTDKKFIDNDGYAEYDNIPMVNIKNYEEKDSVDAIIITPFFYYESIKKDLKSFGVNVPIISLDTILSDIHNKILSESMG